MLSLKSVLLVAALAATALSSAIQSETPKSYHGYKVFKVTVFKDQLEAFNHFRETSGLVADTWKEPTANDLPRRAGAHLRYWSDVLIAPENVEAFLSATTEYKVDLQVEDVGEVIEANAEENMKNRLVSPKYSWDAFYRFDEIDAFVGGLVSEHYDIASSTIIGRSTQGRQLRMVKISKQGSPSNKSAILIDGGFHAREWISPAITTYILNEMLTNRAAHSKILDAVDLYIIPVMNPDGYEHTHTSDRMWRKTRSTTTNPSCYGVDPNRNFDFHFGGPGTSSSPCSEIYHGPSPFSEPETSALRDVIMDKSKNWKSYLTIHSYGQWWLTPWSWTYDLPEDYDDMMEFANTAADALTAVYGTDYLAGATTEILGATAGCADDWAKAVGGIKYANTIEVRDTGRYGFIMPPSQIRETAIETWEGIKAACLFKFD